MIDQPATDRILIVDDSRESAIITQSFLSRGGFAKSDVVSSGKQALELLLSPETDTDGGIQREPVELVVLDIVMPDMDGIEVCARLRSHPRTRHLPVLMLTASRDVETLNQAYMAGANDFVVKPIDGVRLLARVRSLLRLRREQRRRQMREEELIVQNRKLQEGLLDVAVVDPETQLPRRILAELMLRTCRQQDRKAAIGIAQIADFGLYQEMHGREASSRLLGCIMDEIRQTSAGMSVIPCYYGSGGFLLIEPDAGSIDAVWHACEALRENVAEAAIPHGNSIHSKHVVMLTNAIEGAGAELDRIGAELFENIANHMVETD